MTIMMIVLNLRGLHEKYRDWCHTQFISISNNQLHDFPFTIIPSSLMHFSIHLYHASMHFWKDSPGMPLSSAVTTPLMTSTPSKRVLLMTPWAWERETWSKISWIGREVLFSHEFPDAQGIVSRVLWWSNHHLSRHNSRPAVHRQLFIYMERTEFQSHNWLTTTSSSASASFVLIRPSTNKQKFLVHQENYSVTTVIFFFLNLRILSLISCLMFPFLSSWWQHS